MLPRTRQGSLAPPSRAVRSCSHRRRGQRPVHRPPKERCMKIHDLKRTSGKAVLSVWPRQYALVVMHLAMPNQRGTNVIVRDIKRQYHVRRVWDFDEDAVYVTDESG